MVPKRNLGKRYTCHSCGAKYYDLNRPNAQCPRCSADPEQAPSPDPKTAAMAKFKAESAAARRSGAAVVREPLDLEEEDLDPDTFDDEDEVGDLSTDDEDEEAPEDMGEYDDDF